MSSQGDDRKPSRSSNDLGRGPRSGRDTPSRPARGAGKSYSEMRYQAGRGDGRGPRGRDRGKDRNDVGAKPGTLGDGDKDAPSTPKSEADKVKPPPDIPSSKVMSAADLEAQWQQEDVKKMEEEKKKKEEEERLQREEEEKQRKEEEERKKKEEEARLKEEEERKTIDDYIAESAARNSEKMLLRDKNLHADEYRPEDCFFSKLDSSLKKNTAFVKKLKLLSESQKDSLTKDFNGLNLTKYIGEAASAITEAKLKMSDISCAVHLCSIIHQRYADFAACLLENWMKYLPSKKDDKITNPSKYRVDLRFFAELVAVGVFKAKEGLPILANQLAYLINNDKEEHNNLSILTSFCKHCGDDYAGLLPRKFRLLTEKYERDVPRSKVLPKERQKGCQKLLVEYFTSLSRHLVADHKNLKNMEKQNRKTLLTKGELSNERKEKFEEAYNNYQKLYSNTGVMADLLDEDMPDLPEEDYRDEDGGLDMYNPLKNLEFQYEGDSSLWEDEETRTLYECLPDLKASIPGILYKESEGGVKEEPKEADSGMEEDLENLNIEDVEREMETEQQIAEEEKKNEEENKKDDGDKEVEKEEKEGDTAMEQLGLLPPVVEDDEETGSLMKLQFEAYAQSLPTCVNRDLIDKAAIEFCMNFNTKTNRKKLVRALFTVHRTRYDLLPFYSRLVGTLYPCMPDVANDLIQFIKGDFRWHVRKKDQINIESKLKTVRFIGELVKFKLFPKSESLHCLKMLLFDFSHHNIEMACALLETCGRFLYRSPDSHHRTRVYLDVMMRKKSALMMDSRYSTMIENAYYYSNPPDTPQVPIKIRPPMHEYVRKLLYKDLSKVTTEKVLRQIRKLNWDDPEIAFYATKCLIAVWNIRYNSVHCAANLLAGIAPYHETVAIQVVDGVLEDIRIGMEINHPKYNQRRVSCSKYLGELYNYRMVESAVVFKTLYTFITFGVATQEDEISLLDPPEHLFRIRLVCTVLETCGQYFDKGSSKKKLDCFLIYFQRYYWFKKSCPIWSEDRPFPVDIENLFHDTVEAVRPKLKLSQNFEEALKACEELEDEYKSKIAAILPSTETGDEVSEAEDGSLAIIHEADETSDMSQPERQHDEGESDPSQEDRSMSQTETTDTPASLEHQDGTVSEGEDDDDEGDDDGDEADDEYMDTDHDMDEDEVLVMKSGPKRIDCPEDDDFMTAFDKMMEDTSKARNSESLKVPNFDVSVPVNLKGSKKKFELNPEPVIDTTIKFTLITKRGNKQQYSDLSVPVSAEFATKFKEREEQERMEKEKMKQVVLNIHERQEEEDYQEMLAAASRPCLVNNNNRERRVRYQHPKGAPDADEIFGSKTKDGQRIKRCMSMELEEYKYTWKETKKASTEKELTHYV